MHFVPTLPLILLLGVVLAPAVFAQGEVVLPKDPYAAAVALPLSPPVADGVPVDVFDGDKKPVVGVSVLVVDNKQVERKVRLAIGAASRLKHDGNMEMGYLNLLCLHGKRYQTDARGRAMVMRARRGLLMVLDGRKTSVATFAVRAGAEPRRVRMVFASPKGIDVLVVDHRGKPVAGVPVALVQQWSHGHRSKMVSQVTDRDGRVRLDNSTMRYYTASFGLTFRVEPWIPLRNPIGVEVDPKSHVNDPNKPIKLVLPPYGQVRVYVTDEQDRPVRGIDKLLLQVPQGFQNPATYEVSAGEQDYGTFPFVEVGVEVTVWCNFRGMARPQRLVEAGPRHFQELRVLTLKGVSAPLAAQLIVQDAAGQVLKSESVGVLFAGQRDFQGKVVRTDREGRLRVLVPNLFETGDGFLTIVRRGPGPKLHGALRVPFSRLRENPDLGALKLQEEPLLVQGVVVDPQGKPIKGVTVATNRRYTVAEYGSSSTSGRTEFFYHRVVTGADGKFELRELGQDRGGVKLSIHHSWKEYFIVDGETADLAAENHRVILDLGTTISGSFVGIPADSFFPGSIQILELDGSRAQNLRVGNSTGGKFSVQRCPPGIYRIEFRLPLQKKPFLVVDKIEVLRGKDCVEPRLLGIDLGKYGKVITVEIVDENQNPVRNAMVTLIRNDKNGRSSHGFGFSGSGKRIFVVPPGGVEAQVSVWDGKYRTVKIKKLDSDLTVVMKPGFRVALKVGNLPKLPGSVAIEVRATNRTPGASAGYQQRFLGADGKLTFFVSAPGEYDLTLRPMVRRSRGGNFAVNRRQHRPEFRFEFTIEDGEKAAAVKPVAVEFEEVDLEIIQEFVEAAKRKKD